MDFGALCQKGTPKEVTKHLKNISQEEKNKGFMAAVRADRTDLVNLLLDHGADVHYNDDAAICYAARNNKYEMARLLAERGANVEAQDHSPVRDSSEYGYYRLCFMLTDDFGADSSYARIGSVAETFGLW